MFQYEMRAVTKCQDRFDGETHPARPIKYRLADLETWG